MRAQLPPQNQVTPQISWLSSGSPEAHTVPLVLLVYARILYELAELNEGRVARDLIRFLDQVCAGSWMVTARPGGPACLWAN